ncbi:Crp/Fnr family transcriptional regulator [Sphingomonas abietis]|uniref:Crp/Fnr family transcriptional regulator n=1 Tax=Sphingomonas abietis TaxID=3012344 RepID=A0ABY7NMU3_9SPHN|nr:Crp/Fnr family transcriptional regulator [Sphingomonas abietis]WBO22840.1 Crp/Fnr family transcriptional regulator [Sphingomonas abietis]
MFRALTTILQSTTMPSPVCVLCQVRGESICGSLDDSELGQLHAIGRRQHIQAGETVIWAGEESPNCANILSGVFKLSALTIDGREQIVGLLHPADFIGHPYASEAEFTVTALSECEICLFPTAAFVEILESHPPFALALLKRSFETLDAARRRILLFGRQSAEERVAGFLLEMAGRPGASRATNGGPVTFELPLSRGGIADVLGLTIETVSRQMTKLRMAGTIALPGGRLVTVLNRNALERHAGKI